MRNRLCSPLRRGPLVANGRGGQPPARLSREEMNKHVFSNAQEGESHTKTLQGVKSEEHEIITNEASSPTDRKAKARRIRWGAKKQENTHFFGRFANGGGGGAAPPPPQLFLNCRLCCFLPPPYSPCFFELQTLLLSLSPTTIRVVANATTTTTRTKTVTQQLKQQQQQQRRPQ